MMCLWKPSIMNSQMARSLSKFVKASIIRRLSCSAIRLLDIVVAQHSITMHPSGLYFYWNPNATHEHASFLQNITMSELKAFCHSWNQIVDNQRIMSLLKSDCHWWFLGSPSWIPKPVCWLHDHGRLFKNASTKNVSAFHYFIGQWRPYILYFHVQEIA